MNDEQAAAPQADAASPKSRGARDRYVKRGFLGIAVVAIILLWYFVQYRGPKFPDAYTNAGVESLPAALEKAKAENRKVLVLVYHQGIGGPGDTYKRLVDKVMSKKHNVQAFKNSGALFVRVRDSDPAVKRYDIKDTPVTLLLRPDGELAYRMDGNIGEAAFRGELLAAPPVRFLSSLAEAFAQAKDAPAGQTRRILVLVDAVPPSEDGVAFTSRTMWAKGNVEAIENAKVICVRVSPGDPSLEPYTKSEEKKFAHLPGILLLAANGVELTRRAGVVDPEDFRERLLQGLGLQR